MEEQLLGVPVTRDVPCTLGAPTLKVAAQQKAEIEACDLEVTRIHVVAPDEPVRFYVKFRVGQQSFTARGKLEQLGYSVRQKLNDKELCFYVVKAVVETKGWDV